MLHLAPEPLGTQHQVAVRRGGERVANDQERHVRGQRLVEHAVDALLDKLAVRHHHLASVNGLQALLGHAKDGGVRLEVHALALLHRLEAVHGDILLVAEAEAHDVQHGAESRDHRERERGGGALKTLNWRRWR